MVEAPSQRPPDVSAEATEEVEEELLGQIAGALAERFELGDEQLSLRGRDGDKTAWLRMRLGPAAATWELELFSRDVLGWGLDGALGVLVDYLDGFLEQWLAKAREGWAPLDWEGRPYALDEEEEVFVFVRGEVRDLDAEAAADRLLNSN